MDKTQTAVSLALRGTETCTTIADVREITRPGDPEDSDVRRVLAVITHQHNKALNTEEDKDGNEEDGW